MSGTVIRANGSGAWVALGAVLLAAAALVGPPVFWLLLGGLAAAAILLLAASFPVTASVLWLTVVGLTPEMWFQPADPDALFGGGRIWSMVIAGEKLAGFGLVGMLILRFGLVVDIFNPALGFAVIALWGAARGLDSRLLPMDSVRSLFGAASLYAFSFARLPRVWADAVILVVRLLPPGLVLVGAAMDAVGFRPLFVEDGTGLRLGATSHPAFLAGMALTAVEAALLQLLRGGRCVNLGLIAVNGVILVLSGARAPLAIGVLISALALLLVPGRVFGARARTALVLAAGLVATAVGAAAAGGLFEPLRLFSMLGSGATDLSNRDMIWPVFGEAWRLSPVWGLGVGAGKIILSPESLLAHLVGTTAAHNEYLRMLVEGGVAGLALLIVMFVGWVWTRTRTLSLPDRIFMRLVFLGFAIHCYTDNVLIATSSSVFFTWVSAAFARSGEAR